MKQFIFVIILSFPILLSSQQLLFKAGHPKVIANQVAYEISVENFTDIVSIQYCISYDSTILSFVRVINFNLPGLDLSNFYPSQNHICNLWYDPYLLGYTVPDSTVLYRIVFEMLNGTYGGVCFGDGPIAGQFVNIEDVIPTIWVVDDCHAEPFETNLPVATHEITKEDLGLIFQQMTYSDEIRFSTDTDQTIEFSLFDITGREVENIPETFYQKGNNSIDLQHSFLPGLFILTTRIKNQQIATKIIFQ